MRAGSYKVSVFLTNLLLLQCEIFNNKDERSINKNENKSKGNRLDHVPKTFSASLFLPAHLFYERNIKAMCGVRSLKYL